MNSARVFAGTSLLTSRMNGRCERHDDGDVVGRVVLGRRGRRGAGEESNSDGWTEQPARRHSHLPMIGFRRAACAPAVGADKVGATISTRLTPPAAPCPWP